jgi:adenylate cyclase
MAEQRFVARQGQLDDLHAYLSRMLQSQGQVAFVVGEAGSGKTALITEFATKTESADADLVVTIGNCNAQIGIGDPYLPFREILAQLTGISAVKQVRGLSMSENTRRLKGLVRWSCDAFMDLGLI